MKVIRDKYIKVEKRILQSWNLTPQEAGVFKS